MPRVKTLVADEIAKRARALELETDQCLPEPELIVNYVISWLENGKTLLELAKEIPSPRDPSRMVGHGTLRDMFLAQCKKLGISDSDADLKLAKARAAGSYAMIDESKEIIWDAPTHDRESLEKAKLKAQTLQWQAGRFNQATFGDKPSQVTVNLSMADQHLNALRARVYVPPAPKSVTDGQPEAVEADWGVVP